MIYGEDNCPHGRNTVGIDFVKTQLTLIEHMSRRESGGRESCWAQFFDLYYPAMLKYAELYCDRANAEDVVQCVLVKIADAVSTGRYVKRPGTTFRSYLKKLIRNQFLDWRRTEAVRGLGRKVDIAGLAAAVSDDPGEKMDAEWRVALHSAAVEHVLCRMAMPDAMRRAYRAHVLEGRSVREVARELGVSENYVALAKSRIAKRVAAVEAICED